MAWVTVLSDSLSFPFLLLCCSNRVEAWTRDVRFLLRQEGRPVSELVGNMSTVRVMTKDWKITDEATQWIRQTSAVSREPFALYLGLNLPHPYQTSSLGPTAGGSTFRSSLYWLTKVYPYFASLIRTTWNRLLFKKCLFFHTHPHIGVFWARLGSEMAAHVCHAPCWLLLYGHQKLQRWFHRGGDQKHSNLLLRHVCWSWRHAGLVQRQGGCDRGGKACELSVLDKKFKSKHFSTLIIM